MSPPRVCPRASHTSSPDLTSGRRHPQPASESLLSAPHPRAIRHATNLSSLGERVNPFGGRFPEIPRRSTSFRFAHYCQGSCLRADVVRDQAWRIRLAGHPATRNTRQFLGRNEIRIHKQELSAPGRCNAVHFPIECPNKLRVLVIADV